MMSDNIHQKRVGTIRGRLLPGCSPVTVGIAAGVVETVEPFHGSTGEAIATDLPYLAPAFTDIQVNGYSGHDYSSPDLTRDDVEALSALLARSGVVRHLPTIITNPEELICRNVRMIAEARASSPFLANAIPGIHIEGPFIAAEDGPRGAHDAHYVRPPDLYEYRRWQDAADDAIRMVTLAPERRGALKLIEELKKDGVVPAIGHTGAAPERIREAVAAGAVISTHLGNGSHGMLPRLNNYLMEQMTDDRLMASIVADGYHLPAAAMKAIVRAKGPERLILVSDATVLGGSNPGTYKWGNVDVEVYLDGHLGLAGTEFLAGAGHLLDRGIAQVVATAGIPLEGAVRLCTKNPAQLIGLTQNDIAPGERADMVAFYFDPGDQAISVVQTVAAGAVVYEREPALAGS